MTRESGLRALAVAFLLAAALPCASAPGPDAQRRWQAAGSYPTGRFWGALRKLRDGRVVYAGGLREGVARGFNDMDVYDPRSGDWSPGPPMNRGRYEFASASLADGRLLVAGGHGANGAPTASAEIYDPLSDSWTLTASMRHPRLGHRMVMMPDGRVLAAGGFDGSAALSSAEIFDPARGVWSEIAGMSSPHVHPIMQVLPNGKILIAGGSGGVVASDIFDPGSGEWQRAGSMHVSRYLAASGIIADGRLLVAGGAGASGAVDAVESYDSKTRRWTLLKPLLEKRLGPAMIVTGGTALVIAGQTDEHDLASTEYYEASSDSWLPGPPLRGGRCYPEAALLDDGRIMIAGGRRGLAGGEPLASAEILGAFGKLRGPDIARLDPTVAPARIVYAPVPKAPRLPSPPNDPDAPEILPPAAAPNPHAHAIVIGIERYRETLPRADFAAGDAALAAEYFRRVLGVPEENLVVLKNDRATKSDFEKYFERWLPNRVEPGDEVYVYFSGHGAPNPRSGESFLVPYDADPTYIEQTGYSIKRVYENLGKLKAKRVVLALDSCFSGAGGRSVIAQGARPLVHVVDQSSPPGLIVITASAGDQISNSYQAKRHGLFTYFFLRGLKRSGGDFRAVYDYLKPEVTRIARREYNAEQVPQWRSGSRRPAAKK